jgi:hypothetical protein
MLRLPTQHSAFPTVDRGQLTILPTLGQVLTLGHRSAMHSLSFVVLTVCQIDDSCDDGAGPAKVNRQAFLELEKWILECQGRPRRWDQYQEWPSRVLPGFLDLVALGDDTALLVLIHWTAVMSRSTKRFIKMWAIRAGLSAVSRLQGDWREQLAWPLEVLAPPVAMESDLQLPSYTEPGQPPTSDLAMSGNPHWVPIAHDEGRGMPACPYCAAM